MKIQTSLHCKKSARLQINPVHPLKNQINQINYNIICLLPPGLTTNSMHILPRICHYLKIGRNSLPIICQLELQLFLSKTHKSILHYFQIHISAKNSTIKLETKLNNVYIYMQFYGIYISNHKKIIE